MRSFSGKCCSIQTEAFREPLQSRILNINIYVNNVHSGFFLQDKDRHHLRNADTVARLVYYIVRCTIYIAMVYDDSVILLNLWLCHVTHIYFSRFMNIGRQVFFLVLNGEISLWINPSIVSVTILYVVSANAILDFHFLTIFN